MPVSVWRKSSRSASDGNCVEVAWRKSSFSSASDGDCVEVAFGQLGAAVRDSKNPHGPQLAVPATAWLELTKLTRR
jgi:hypothetical protein